MKKILKKSNLSTNKAKIIIEIDKQCKRIKEKSKLKISWDKFKEIAKSKNINDVLIFRNKIIIATKNGNDL